MKGQIALVHLLAYLDRTRLSIAGIRIAHPDRELWSLAPEPDGTLPTIPLTRARLDTASRVWRAFAAPTPEPTAALQASDLSVLPHLARTVRHLLRELPDANGLGATERAVLALAGAHATYGAFVHAFHAMPEQETDIHVLETVILPGLAAGPAPLVEGFCPDLFRDAEAALRHPDPQAAHKARFDAPFGLTPLGRRILDGHADRVVVAPFTRDWLNTRLGPGPVWRFDPGTGTLIPPC